MQLPGSQPGGSAQICSRPFYPQRADRSCSSPLQNSGNGALFLKSRESSQLFLPFPRTPDFTHGLQRICAPAPKAKTVQRFLQLIYPGFQNCTPSRPCSRSMHRLPGSEPPGSHSCTLCSEYDPRDPRSPPGPHQETPPQETLNGAHDHDPCTGCRDYDRESESVVLV